MFFATFYPQRCLFNTYNIVLDTVLHFKGPPALLHFSFLLKTASLCSHTLPPEMDGPTQKILIILMAKQRNKRHKPYASENNVLWERSELWQRMTYYLWCNLFLWAVSHILCYRSLCIIAVYIFEYTLQITYLTSQLWFFYLKKWSTHPLTAAHKL